MTAILAAFLMVHGFLHLAIWLRHFASDTAKPAPFRPDHSAVLSAVHTPHQVGHWISIILALGAAWLYVSAGGLGALGMTGATTLAGTAALWGIALKVVFFHPWMTIGLVLDICVLLAAISGWPLTFT